MIGVDDFSRALVVESESIDFAYNVSRIPVCVHVEHHTHKFSVQLLSPKGASHDLPSSLAILSSPPPPVTVPMVLLEPPSIIRPRGLGALDSGTI